MDLVGLTEELRELVELFSPPTIPIPKQKPGIHPGKYGYDPEPSDKGTKHSRPSNVGSGGGDGTQAGVKPKSVSDKTSTKAKARDNTKTKELPASKGGGKPPSCPGGKEPRMVFGKWRCGAPRSKGAAKAQSRIATKRKQKAKKPKVGGLAKLVNKARAALKGLFK
jgi:hypothetical protein